MSKSKFFVRKVRGKNLFTLTQKYPDGKTKILKESGDYDQLKTNQQLYSKSMAFDGLTPDYMFN